MAMYLKCGVFLMFVLLLSACKQNGYEFISKEVDPTDSISSLDTNIDDSHSNVGRAIWQKPGLVIEKLGDISDKVIADIGAGTGYFSFKLALKAKKVIAVEIEQGLLDYIDSTKVMLPENKRSRIETRLATPDDPSLKVEEVDIILIINTIAYIKDLPEYLQTLKKCLKKDGKIMIIDYKMKRLPINSPPKSERLYLDHLEDVLIDAGYKLLKVDDTSLDYQYIIKAEKIN